MNAEDIKAHIDEITRKRDTWGKREELPLTIEQARIETTVSQSHVWATIGEVERVVFSYYPDELSFTASEFVGVTIEQARELHMERDIAWLQS